MTSPRDLEGAEPQVEAQLRELRRIHAEVSARMVRGGSAPAMVGPDPGGERPFELNWVGTSAVGEAMACTQVRNVLWWGRKDRRAECGRSEAMISVEKSIDVEVPVRQVYDQWTQFEDFPHFMEGVERVEQLDETKLRWEVNIAGVDHSFEAKIGHQEPDERISWRATGGEDHAGVVTFVPVDGGTRINLEMTYQSDRWADKVADLLNIVDHRVEGDLKRFKSYIEERQGRPTGGWRGEVQAGQEVTGQQDGVSRPAPGFGAEVDRSDLV